VKEACGHFEEAIQLHLDGALPAAERLALESHLEGCSACSAEMETFTLLLSGLDAMPLEEPSADFNSLVMSRISFPVAEQVSAKRTIMGVRPGLVYGLPLGAFSAFALFMIIRGSGRISSVLSGGFLDPVGAMEWLSMSSIQGVKGLVTLMIDMRVFSSLLLVGKILLNATVTTMSDPVFALMLAVLVTIGAASTVIMTKLVKPSWSRPSNRDAGMTRKMHFF